MTHFRDIMVCEKAVLASLKQRSSLFRPVRVGIDIGTSAKHRLKIAERRQ